MAEDGSPESDDRQRPAQAGPLQVFLFGIWLTALGAFLAAVGGGASLAAGALAVVLGTACVVAAVVYW